MFDDLQQNCDGGVGTANLLRHPGGRLDETFFTASAGQGRCHPGFSAFRVISFCFAGALGTFNPT
jgi:hypothetical protein